MFIRNVLNVGYFLQVFLLMMPNAKYVKVNFKSDVLNQQNYQKHKRKN